jgi:hypothetical protein
VNVARKERERLWEIYGSVKFEEEKKIEEGRHIHRLINLSGLVKNEL